MKTRISTFLLAVLLLLSLIPTVLAAEDDCGLQMTAIEQDDTIVVQASLADCEAVSNGRLEITYDSEAVTFERAVPANDGWIVSINHETENVVSFAWVASELPAGTVPVTELIFSINDITTLTGTSFSGQVTELYRTGTAVTLTTEEAAAQAEIICGQVPFTDIDGWYKSNIEKAYRAGLVNGVTDTRFVPQGTMTRGMFVTVLYRLAGEPEAPQSSPFQDVEPEKYYADAIAWASEAGVVKGISQTRFNPNGSIARQEMVTMLYRYAMSVNTRSEGKVDLTQFPDAASVAGWARDAMAWAVAEEIIIGSGGQLQPIRSATRAEAVTVVCRFAGF